MGNSDFIIKGPAMIPGVTDRVGDRQLTGEEIQKGAYQFMESYGVVDVQHTFKKVGEPVESYIAPEETRFNNITYPAGTWFITTKVTDPDVQEAIMKGELTGYSVGALPEKEYSETKRNIPITKAMFNDVQPGKWFPFTVSIVDIPAVEDAIFKVFKPLEFIKKDYKLEDNIMSEDKARDTILEKMFDYFIKKEDKEVVKTETEVESEFITKSDLEAFKAELLESIKADEDEDEDETVETEEVEEIESDESEEDIDDDTEEDGEDVEPTEPAGEPITKAIPIDQKTTKPVKGYMESLGRDSFGRKITD